MMRQLFRRNRITRKARIVVLLSLIFSVASPAFATDEPVWSTFFRGKTEIAVGQAKETADVNFYNAPFNTLIDNPANDKYVNSIALYIDEGDSTRIPVDTFHVGVTMNIIWVNMSGVTDSITGKQLRIKYDARTGFKYDQRNYFIFDNARKVKVRITAVDTTGSNWDDVLKVVVLENKMEVRRDYQFSCATGVLDLGAELVQPDELRIEWDDDVLSGRTHYDVEWTWVDNETLDRYMSVHDAEEFDTIKIFRNNSSRVTIPYDSCSCFRVPMLYDGDGYLFYRVRPVQYREDGTIVEGTWSTDVSGGMGVTYYEFGGHEIALNWQASTTYVENGLHKTVVQYFDGTLRSRQTVTKDNVTHTTVVAETWYDYQGRPAINILPAPTINTVIGFAKNFNRFEDGDDPKELFDLVPIGQEICAQFTPLLDSASGASRYYSANNDSVNVGFHQYIPSAFGFPYSETRYTPDATGRIAAQGGVGRNHRMGSGHETKYFYGAADQKELDGLFGTEVGDNSHYFKNMVRDANGQYSVSYVDMHGRTIATALAGKTPDEGMDSIVTYKPRFLTRNLLANGNNTVKDRSVESSSSLLVTKAGDHEFVYELSPQSAEIAACNPEGQPVCYNCYYDLEISITGTCGEPPFYIKIDNFTLGDYDTSCSEQPHLIIDTSFTLFLTEGEYNITKRLSLSRDAQDWYRDSIFSKTNICQTLEDYYNTVYDLMLDDSSCIADCQTCTDSLGSYDDFKEKFLAELGVSLSDSLLYKKDIVASYAEAKAACDAICTSAAGENKLASIRQAMIEDMTPDQGQYATLDRDLTEDGDFDDWIDHPEGYTEYETNTNRPFNIFNHNKANQYVLPVPLATFPAYRFPREEKGGEIILHYKDESGEKDAEIYQLVPDPANAGLPDVPLLTIITPEDYTAMFKPSWAPSLLYYHPEYPKLKYAETNLTGSYNFDLQIENTDTWAAADAAGYVASVSGLLDLDPFFSGVGNTEEISAGVTYREQMETWLGASYRAGKSMWQLAWAAVTCHHTNDPNCSSGIAAYPPYDPGSCTGDINMVWQIFRGMYLSQKDSLVNVLLDRTSPNIPYDELVSNQYLRRFGSTGSFNIPGAGLFGNMTGDPLVNAGTQYASSEIDAIYDATCEGYIAMWRAKLENCDQIAGHDKKEEILNLITEGLRNVCRRGTDEDHPYGSSTVAPSERFLPPTSFEEVITEVFSRPEYDIDITSICHPYMIDYPQPYDKQSPVSNDVIVEPKDTCLCNRLSALAIEKNNSGYAGNLSSFINYQYGVTVSQGLLDSLSGGCDGSLDCLVYNPPLSVPAILNCKAPVKTCIDCMEYDTLKARFRELYPGMEIIHTDPQTDSVVNENNMFAQFMNSQTGLRKSWYDYLQFEIECANYNDPWSCGRLDSIIAVFYQTYSDTLYGATCQSTFTSFFNSAFGTAYTFSQIETLYMQYCGRALNVCQPKLNCQQFDNVIDSFYHAYGDSIAFSINCQPYFVTHFNDWYDTDYSWQELVDLYRKLCGKTLDICGHFSCDRLQAVLNSFKDCNRTVYQDSTCTIQWINYFNALMSTSLEGWQIDSLYQRCGIPLDVCQSPVNCKTLQLWLQTYHSMGNAACQGSGLDTLDADFCRDCFVWFMDDKLGINYSYEQLVLLFQKSCGTSPAVCKSYFDCKKLTTFTGTFIQWYQSHTGDGPCDSLFAVKFNEEFETAYNYGQVLDVYRLYCGRIPAVCKHEDILTCAQLDRVYKEFKTLYPDPSKYFSDNCQIAFTKYFNHAFGDSLSYFDIARYYQTLCKRDLDICAPDTCLKLQNFLTKYNTLYGSYQLPQQLCRDLFTNSFNNEFAPKEKHTWVELVKMYLKCGITLDICPPDTVAYSIPCENLEAARKAFYVYHRGKLPVGCDQLFAGFFNLYFKTSFTNYGQLEQWARDNCGNPLNICGAPAEDVAVKLRSTAAVIAPALPPRLCGVGAPLFPDVIVDEPDPCDFLSELALNAATEKHTVYVQQQKDKFDSTYRSKCLNVAPLETFTVRAEVAEYHYTLYYYNQAGNLVKTVPPQGVHTGKLDEDSIDNWHDAVKAARIAGTVAVPPHILPTNYRYNTLNQVIAQESPDGGLSKFFYDRLGRPVASQNEQQGTVGKYSYTKFDELGRIIEVGQLLGDEAVTQAITKDPEDLEDWLSDAADTREQITNTFYDLPADIPSILSQANLRNRVSYTTLTDTIADPTYASASYFSYDIHGNVDTLVQHYFKGIMQEITGNAFKKMVYKYDLVSGSVNEVAYQPGYRDEFYHRYKYNADKKLIEAYTSHDYVYWERQSNYQYYKHGPLARVQIGELGVQGVDYAYTLQGWLKGVNSSATGNIYDMGVDDGRFGRGTAADVYSFSLNYYDTTDYKAIKGGKYPFAAVPYGLATLADGVVTGKSLFNGNIASMLVNIPVLGTAHLYGYRYDALNRIKAMNAYTGLNTNNTFTPSATDHYKERVTYDGNGNILTYLRNGVSTGTPLGMDSLTYHYIGGKNQLDHVDDLVANGNYVNRIDIDDQSSGNYEYDSIGNLVKEVVDGQNTYITWNVYGKIASIRRPSENYGIEYTYDAAGNRIGKLVIADRTPFKYTWYVRDAAGNVMAVYQKGYFGVNEGDLTQSEVHLYGSNRLGLWRPNRNVEEEEWWLFETEEMAGTSNGIRTETWTRGKTNYELSNHLGNVLVTITDKRIQHCPDPDEEVYCMDDHLGQPQLCACSLAPYVSYYKAEIVTANDYYPFGMLMPARKFAIGDDRYRYGFNGKENDNDVKGEGNQQDYGMRVYDPRIGKFLSVDPISKSYPELTPYQFASNRPIDGIDLDGKEWMPGSSEAKKAQEYEAKLAIANTLKIQDMVVESLYSAIESLLPGDNQGWPRIPQGHKEAAKETLREFVIVQGSSNIKYSKIAILVPSPDGEIKKIFETTYQELSETEAANQIKETVTQKIREKITNFGSQLINASKYIEGKEGKYTIKVLGKVFKLASKALYAANVIQEIIDVKEGLDKGELPWPLSMLQSNPPLVTKEDVIKATPKALSLILSPPKSKAPIMIRPPITDHPEDTRNLREAEERARMNSSNNNNNPNP